MIAPDQTGSAVPIRDASSSASSSESNVSATLYPVPRGVTLTSAPSARPNASPRRDAAASWSGWTAPRAARTGPSSRAALGQRAGLGLGAADVPALGERGAGEPAAIVVVAGHQDRAAVALGQVAGGEHVERLVGEVEQAQQVRDGDARAPDAAADRLAGEPELLDKAARTRALLTGLRSSRAMFSIRRELERLGVVAGRGRAPGSSGRPGHLARRPAALAGDQLVGAAGRRAHEHGLEHAALAEQPAS
jgi:hypothetical protein